MDPLAAAIEPLIPGLRRYARSWLRDPAMADDVVQDCLERAVGRWRQRRGAEVRPWVYAILHNLLVDHQRQHSRRGTAVPLHLVDDAALGRPADQDAGLHHRSVIWGSRCRRRRAAGNGDVAHIAGARPSGDAPPGG
jgi:DNA-directed RNA polymerase specialized sigma24 family protein